PDGRIAAAVVGPPLVAVPALGRVLRVLPLHGALHPLPRDDGLAVDAAALEHELAQPGVVGQRRRPATAAGVAAVALVADPVRVGLHAVRLPDRPPTRLR